MSTRGLIGIKYKGKTKATYNHFDSYPRYLGFNLVKELKEKDSIKLLKKNFKNIKLVTTEETPTKREINKYKKFLDLKVSKQTEKDWYNLLRNTQGTLKYIISGEQKHMIDNLSFLKDSEWAYIIDLDDNNLEIYEKGNLTKKYPLNNLPTKEKLEKLGNWITG